ncbi:MAG: hypothetical protein E7507_01355 [Ruminococcus sp.]|nr:hypothetical protein [Ruminococcus sp.]
MPLKDVKYRSNQAILKLYDNGVEQKYKLIFMKSLRTSGVEDDEDEEQLRISLDGEKLSESIIRSKRMIYEYAYCNQWDFFFTGTLDKDKYDREDLDKFHKDLTQWFRDYKKKYGQKIDFLLIPELHKDKKSWHIHGLLRGILPEHLKQFEIGDKMSDYLVKKVKNGETVYNWSAYQKKFGFCNLEPIKNHSAVCSYITKYITKDLAFCVKKINAHIYYCSRGLNRAQIIAKGDCDFAMNNYDYENDFCRISWFVNNPLTVEEIIESFYIDSRKFLISKVLGAKNETI